jgi:3-oxoacyl-[acyl-carrier-protein] synthase-1
MFLHKERVAITGLGIISCIGNNCIQVLESLHNGNSGIQLLNERKKMGFNSGLSGVIQHFDPEEYLNRKQRKTLPEFGLWAWAAISQALSQSGLNKEQLRGNPDAGFIFGNDSSSVTVAEQIDILRKTGDTKPIGSGHIFRSLTSTITLNISTLLGIRGMSWTVSSACASGAMAIGQGAELIAAGRQKCIICGGAQEISWQSMCSFDTIDAFSKRETDPARASRPFDSERDGLVPSGGAAALILESFTSAQSRGARILGEVTGYGTTTDGFHIVLPSGEGIERSMRLAIQDAGLEPGDIDAVLAHATSTPAGDEKEALAINNIFGHLHENKPIITALKGRTGHEFWMAGASQAVYGLLMAGNNFIAGNLTLKNPDGAACKLNLPRKNIPCSLNTILCNGSGFGGTNASLVLQCNNFLDQ